jgi:hypothetical protein
MPPDEPNNSRQRTLKKNSLILKNSKNVYNSSNNLNVTCFE